MSYQFTRKVPKRTRFAVLHRDNFTCQYCGQFAPNVEVEVDHITPLAQGGTNEPDNLLVACFDCNRGKGDTILESDGELKSNPAKASRSLRDASGRRIFVKIACRDENAREGFIYKPIALLEIEDYKQLVDNHVSLAQRHIAEAREYAEDLSYRYNVIVKLPFD